MASKNITVRYFAYTTDGVLGVTLEEVSVYTFEEINAPIGFERHTLQENGVRQICLIKENYDEPLVL